MPCSPTNNNLNPIVIPGIPIPGFGVPYSPFQIPLPQFDIPLGGLVEDIVDLMNKLGALWPSGLLKADMDLDTKDVMGFVMKILSKISPFLSVYNFFMALLNLITCIIEVLCAIPNPFAVASKLAKLFSTCLPPFINLFPFLALIAMILAIILLIIALIDYIIATVLAIIDSIIANLTVLAQGITLNDAQSVLAAAEKIASGLCFIQNILAVLVAIAAIFGVIQALANFAGVTICDDNDPDGCCSPDICPPFIKNSSGIQVTNGKMIYLKQVGVDFDTLFASAGLPPDANLDIMFAFIQPTRKERWQIFDQVNQAAYPINSIITPYIPLLSDNIFWPEDKEFKATNSKKSIPYLVDLNITLDPHTLGFADFKGERKFLVKDCYVVTQPYIGVYQYDNSLSILNPLPNPIFNTGTLNIEGGKVFEVNDDGSTTAYSPSGTQLTLNTFIHQEDIKGTSLPSTDDSFVFDVEFTWYPQHGALASYDLITVGCMPEVNIEKAVFNAMLTAEGIGPINLKLPNLAGTNSFLPDINGAQACLNNAIAKFRTNVSPSTGADFRATVTNCLNNLRNQSVQTYSNAFLAGASQFKSTFTLSPQIQFTTRPITVTAQIQDASGTLISTNIPTELQSSLASQLVGEATLGKISGFTYDGVSSFTAKITSDVPGDGQVSLVFNNKTFNKLIPTDGTNPSSIQEYFLSYTFIDGSSDSLVRRDASDTAGV